MIRPRRHILTALAVAAALAGCEPDDDLPCDPGCPADAVCDVERGVCVDEAVDAYAGEPPATSVDLTLAGERVFAAALDLDAGQVVAGTVDGGDGEFVVLGDDVPAEDAAVALASGAERVVVAWLDDAGRYQFAAHTVGESLRGWQRLEPPDATTLAFRGSTSFDVAVDSSGLAHLVFRSADIDALRYLRQDGQGGWQLVDVDVAGSTLDRTLCSPDVRRTSGRGVGWEPALEISATAVVAAYHDADCGDLRIARLVDGSWTVGVVDTGDFELGEAGGQTRGFTGRFASLAVDDQGRLALAYQDVRRGRLMFAFDDDGRFRLETADPGFELDAFGQRRKHLVGGFASLAFDSRGIAWVAYMDQTATRVRLAHRTRSLDQTSPTSWVRQTVDARAPAGFSTALVYGERLGKLVGAERLVNGAAGLESRLILLPESAL